MNMEIRIDHVMADHLYSLDDLALLADIDSAIVVNKMGCYHRNQKDAVPVSAKVYTADETTAFWLLLVHSEKDKFGFFVRGETVNGDEHPMTVLMEVESTPDVADRLRQHQHEIHAAANEHSRLFCCGC